MGPGLPTSKRSYLVNVFPHHFPTNRSEFNRPGKAVDIMKAIARTPGGTKAQPPFSSKDFTPAAFWGPARPGVHLLGRTAHAILILSLFHEQSDRQAFYTSQKSSSQSHFLFGSHCGQKPRGPALLSLISLIGEQLPSQDPNLAADTSLGTGGLVTFRRSRLLTRILGSTPFLRTQSCPHH